MTPDDLIRLIEAEAELTGHASDVLARRLARMDLRDELLAIGEAAGQAVGAWGDAQVGAEDDADDLAAQAAFDAFPPRRWWA